MVVWIAQEKLINNRLVWEEWEIMQIMIKDYCNFIGYRGHSWRASQSVIWMTVILIRNIGSGPKISFLRNPQ